MVSWDLVNTDWDPEEETTNFGTRHCVIAGNSIFDVTTVATIGSSNEDESRTVASPAVTGKCIGNEAAVAIDAYVHVFDVVENVLKASLELPATVECLTWSPSKHILAIACQDGTVAVFHSASQTMLVQNKIASSKSARTFAGLSFQKETECYCIFALQTNGVIIKISGLNLDAISDSLASGSYSKASFMSAISITSWNIAMEDAKIIYIHLFKNGCKTQALLTTNNAILLYDFENKDVLKAISWDCSITFSEQTSNKRIIFALDDRGRILKLCAQTFLLLSVWDSVPVKQLILLDYGTQEDLRLLTLTANDQEGDCSIQVRNIGDFSLVFSLKLWSFSYLLPFQGDVDHIMLLEGASSTQSNISSLRLRSFSAALPETRLSRLIARRDFAKAESFAKVFGLPIEAVYKAQACWLLEKLSPWLPHSNRTDKDVAAWFQVLDLIKDMQFICECCWNAALPTLKDAQVALLYARKRLDSSREESFEEHAAWKLILNTSLQRLATVRLLYSKQPIAAAVEAWYSLSRSLEALEWAIEYLEQGQVAKALLIWDRHEAECLSRLPSDLEELLTSAAKLSVQVLSTFLCRILPPVLRTIPESLSMIADFSVNKTKSLEVSEPKSWPGCAFEFASTILECMKSNGNAKLKTEGFIYMDGNLCELATLVESVQEINTLWKVHGIRVDLGTYSQADRMQVVLELLSWVNTAEDMEVFLKDFLLNYMAKYGLDTSQVLRLYVKDVIEDSKEGWWACEEAPWEDMVSLVLKFITNLEDTAAAVMLIAESAPVPWSKTVWNLVNLHIAILPRHYANALTEVASLIPLKTVLRNYNLRHFDLADIGSMKGLVKFILRAGRPERLTHVLEVARACPIISECFVYEAYFHQTLEEGNIDEGLNALAGTSPAIRKVCCTVLVIYALELHDLTCTFPKLKMRESSDRYTECVPLLLKLIEGQQSPEYQHAAKLVDNLKSVRKLRERFGVSLTISDFGKQDQRLLAFHQICLSDLQKLSLENVNALYGRVQEAALLLKLKTGEALCHLCMLAMDNSKEKLLPSLLPLLLEEFSIAGDHDTSLLLETIHKLTLKGKLLEQLELAPQLYFLTALATSSIPKELLLCCVELLLWIHLASQLTPVEADHSFGGMNCQSLCDVYSGFVVGLYQPAMMGKLRACLSLSLPSINGGNAQPVCAALLESVFVLVDSLEESQHLDLALNLLLRLQTMLELWYPSLPKENGDILRASVKGKRKKVAKQLFLHIVGGSRIDFTAALTCLLLMSGEAEVELRDLAERYSMNHRRLAWICQLAVQLGKLRPVDPDTTQSFQVLLSQSLLVRRLAQRGLNVQGLDLTRLLTERGLASPTSEGREIFRVITEFGKLEGDNSDLVILLANNCGQDPQEFLQVYLKSKILSVTYVSQVDLAVLEILFRETTHILSLLSNENRLTLLDSLFAQVNPYFYEVIVYLLESTVSMKHCLTKSNFMFLDRSKQLLAFLKSYTRKKPPQNNIEIISDRFVNNDKQNTEALSKIRLPFPLIVQDFKPILEAEMDLDTWQVWHAAAPLIEMKPDDVCVVAVSNSVDEFLDKLQRAIKEGLENALPWHAGSPNHTFLTALQECVYSIQDKKLAVVCLHQVFNKLPDGEDKVQAGSYCLQMAKAWAQQSRDADATDVFEKVQNRYWGLASQSVLYKYKLATVDYLALCSAPAQLVKALYEDPSIYTSSNKVDINSAAEEICVIHGINVFTLRSAYLSEWLAPVGSSASTEWDDTFLSPGLTPKKQDDSEKQNEINLKRAIYIFKGCVHPTLIPSHVKCVAAIAFGEDASYGPLYRLRALLCIQAVMSEEEVENQYGFSPEKLKEYCGCLKLVSDLEALGLPVAVHSFQKCDYAALAKRLLGGSSTDKRLRVAARVCQYAKLWDPVLWCELLISMIKQKMIEEAQELLAKFVANDSSTMIPAWNAVLQAPFRYMSMTGSLEEVEAGVKSLHLLWKSSSPTDFDLSALHQSIETSAAPYLSALLIPFVISPNSLQIELLGRYSLKELVEKLKSCETLDFPFSLHLQGLLAVNSM